MDYALLAATALGAIGLYLMLPRERAPLVRLGGLLGAMALAGFFLYLVRTVAVGAATGGGEAPPVYFYLFSAITIASAFMVIASRNPVHSVLFLILAFVNAAGLFMLLGAEFLAFILIVVYVGAVAVLFLFVIMMLDIDSSEIRHGVLQYLPFGLLIGGIVLIELLLVVGTWTIGGGVPHAAAMPFRPTSPTPKRSASCSTRATSISSRLPAWCCWSR